MSDRSPADSPLEAAADTVDTATVAAFERLADETRLAILLALWEATEPTAPLTESDGSSLPFSELRERVGAADSGRFNYHLGELADDFVERTEEGYALTTRAERIVRVTVAGALADHPTLDGEPSGSTCHLCGEPAVLDYDDGLLTVRCTGCAGAFDSEPGGTLGQVYRPPVGLANRTPEEFHRHGNTWDRHRFFSMLEGTCPDCAGTVTTTVHVCEEHAPEAGTVCEQCGSLYEIQAMSVCDVCKFHWLTPAWLAAFADLSVKTFCHDRGLDPETALDEFAWGRLHGAVSEVTVRAEDPVELGVVLELDDDRLDVRLDDDAQVVGTAGG
jgi:DNA-binding transcriptional ArsR family regulator